MQNLGRKEKVTLAVLGPLFLITIALLPWAFRQDKEIRTFEAYVEEHAEEFLKLAELPRDDNIVWATPKLLLMDTGEAIMATVGGGTVQPGHKSALHGWFFGIYDAFARKPEDIGTVVILDWSKRQVGFYSNGFPAYQVLCDLTLVDVAKQRVWAEAHFEGQLPPKTRSSPTGKSLQTPGWGKFTRAESKIKAFLVAKIEKEAGSK